MATLPAHLEGLSITEQVRELLADGRTVVFNSWGQRYTVLKMHSERDNLLVYRKGKSGTGTNYINEGWKLVRNEDEYVLSRS